MVKVGFIIEGDTETKIINSEVFKGFCTNLGIEILQYFLPPKGERGKDRLKSVEDMASFEKILFDFVGADFIFIIRDLEDLECIVEAKNEIASNSAHKVIVVKSMESWFIADTLALSNYLGFKEFYVEHPERIDKPFDFIIELTKQHRGRGISDKLIFTGAMLNNGFSIENASKHPNCPSAKYFIDNLKRISEKQKI